MRQFIFDKIRVMTDKLSELKEIHYSDIEFEYIKLDGYAKELTVPTDVKEWKIFNKGDRLCGVDEHFWLHFKTDAVPTAENKSLIFQLCTGREGEWDAKNPQGIVFLDGKIAQALDTNHTWIELEFEREYDVYIYFYTGMEGGYFDVLPVLKMRDIPVYDLYYDINVPFEAMKILEKGSADYISIEKSLDEATQLLDLRYPYSEEFYESVNKMSEYMKNEFYGKVCGKGETIAKCIGHTHIDVAWLWTVEQTREKAVRSFSTVLNLMKKYPDYKFMSSQPQLYQYVKEKAPELYEEIKQRVAEGRWEVEGAMWLEADTNLISGESLIRQIIYGKRFMKEEFGVDSKILWLPDVFGYSGALPQILKKTGVDKFFTTKMTWSETNKMPDEMFIWKGIDGSEVFSAFADSYVNALHPERLRRNWDLYKSKDYTNQFIFTFGYGDGGGGPTAEMLENHNRTKYGIPGIPKTVIETSGKYYESVRADFDESTKIFREIPKWDGEMYLEIHRGTYTTIAKNKKNNRKSELLYQEAETLSVADMVLTDGEYDSETMEKNMYTILLNQFHDIIPGSSIEEVYNVTDGEYKVILEDGRNICNEKQASLKKNIKTEGGIFVYNPAPFEISDTVETGGKIYYAENVPAHGYKVIPDAEADTGVIVGDNMIENELIKVVFDGNYEIVSVYDKEAEREVLCENKTGNRLELYEDYPKNHDAWDIDDYYKQKMWSCNQVENVEKTANGLRVTRKYCNSLIVQEILLNKNSKRIDFVTDVDWYEDHVLLKAVFPVDIRTTKATYDIQFGNVERPTHRNTSWEQAKFEVCGHKWADMSEDNYGVSILNDCKYGYSVYENDFAITLLKAPTWPNPNADRGHHSFTYSLYPHTGDFKSGKTIEEGYKLNMPLEASIIGKQDGTLSDSYSLVSCNNENIVVETIKKAEDNDDIIVRFYDSYNRKSTAELDFGFDFKKAYICNMLEENECEIPHEGRLINVPVKNFEIVTLRIVR